MPDVPPSDSAFLPSTGQQVDEPGRTLVRAMFGAAKADGRVELDERQRIEDQLAALGVDKNMRHFVHEELAGPLDIDAIVAPAACHLLFSETSKSCSESPVVS